MRTISIKMISTLLLSAVLFSSCGSAPSAATAQENTTQDAAQASTQAADGQEDTSSDNAEVPAQENCRLGYLLSTYNKLTDSKKVYGRYHT